MSVTSEEINYLVYRYLQESGFAHTAFTFASESLVTKSSVSQVEIPPGSLVAFLQKGLEYLAIEERLNDDGSLHPYQDSYSLLAPQICQSIARKDIRPNMLGKLNGVPSSQLSTEELEQVAEEVKREMGQQDGVGLISKAHGSDVQSTEWMEGDRLLSFSSDGSVKVWQLNDDGQVAVAPSSQDKTNEAKTETTTSMQEEEEEEGKGEKEDSSSSSSSSPSSSFQLPNNEPVTTVSCSQDQSYLSVGTSTGQAHIVSSSSLEPVCSVVLKDPDMTSSSSSSSSSSSISTFTSTFHPLFPDVCYFGTSHGRVDVISFGSEQDRQQAPFHQSFQVHSTTVLDMCFSNTIEGSSSSSYPLYLASASADRTVSVFTFDGNTSLVEEEKGGLVADTASSSSSMQLEEQEGEQQNVQGTNKTSTTTTTSTTHHPLPLFSLDGKHNQILSYHSDEVNRVAFSSQNILASCSDDCTLKLYRKDATKVSSQPHQFHLIRDFRDAVQEVFDLTFHQEDANFIFSGSFDSLLRKYDIDYNTLVSTYQKECSPILSIDQRRSFLVSGHLGGIVNLFDEGSAKHVFGFKLPYDVLKVKLNPHKEHLLSVSYQDGSIGVFDLRKV